MMFRKFIFLFSITCFFACDPSDTDAKPNIILFFVDDLGWQDTSVPFWDKKTPLNEKYKTPNMERLSAKGVKFQNQPNIDGGRILLLQNFIFKFSFWNE